MIFQMRQAPNTKTGGAGVLIEELEKSKLLKKEDALIFTQKYPDLPNAYAAIADSNLVPAEELEKAAARSLGLEYITGLAKKVDPKAKSLIPEQLQVKYRLLPYELRGTKLRIATDNLPLVISGQLPGQLITNQDLEVEFSIVTRDEFNEALGAKSQGQGLPQIDLTTVTIPSLAINKIPKQLAIKYQLVVFGSGDRTLKIALTNPDDAKVQEILKFIRQKNKIQIEEFQTSHESLEAAIAQYDNPQVATEENPNEQNPSAEPVQEQPPAQSANPEIQPQGQQFEVTSAQLAVKPEDIPTDNNPNLDQFLQKPITSIQDLAEIVKTGDVPKIVAATISLAVGNRASDIHLEPHEKLMMIRYRIDGVLQEIGSLPANLAPAMVARIKILAKLKLDEQRIPQDGRMDIKTGKHVVDIRVAIMPTVFGEKVVLRLLDKSSQTFSLEELGLTGTGFDWLTKAIEEPYGVIMATGPTGSGKSTTLYAILTRLNKKQVNIITLEDPVEYELPGVNQTQIKPQIGFTFAEGLRSVLRQDPNVIMVGEIRDAETANLVTQSALTGHLVLTTLHTNDAAGAMPRLVNMGIEPFLITSSVNAVLAQRLLRKLCSDCKREARIAEATLFDIKKTLDPLKIEAPLKFYEGAGCNKCRGTGYEGRIGIFEVMRMTPKMEELIIGKATANEIFIQAVADGMITMKQDGLLKALKGVTSISEVYRVTAS